MASVFQNIVRLSAGDFFAKALNFLAFVYLARVLGVDTFGVLEFAGTLLTWFLLLGDAGLEIWGTREVAQTRELHRLVGRMVPLRLVLAALSFALLLVVLPLLPDYPQLKLILGLFGLSLFAQAVSLKWVFLGQQKMSGVAQALVISQVVFAGIVFGFIRDASLVIWVPLIRFASDVVLAAYFAREYARTSAGAPLQFTLRGTQEILRPALTFGAANAMGLLNFNFDTALLGFIKGATQVGWYSAAYKPVTIALALPLTYFVGLFPALASAASESKQKLGELAERSLRLCAIAAVPLGIGGTLLAEPIILLLYGEPYHNSALPLQILIWSAVLVILRGSYRHSINAAGRQDLDLRCAATSAATNVALNLALIPPYGMVGAATATVLGDLVWFGMAWHYFRHAVGRMNPFGPLGRPLASGAAMAACIYFTAGWHWAVRGLAGTMVYFVALALLGEPELRKLFGNKTNTSIPTDSH